MIVKITFHWGNILCPRNFMHIVLPLKVWEVRNWKTQQFAFWRKTLQLQSSMWFCVFHSTEPFNPTKWLVTSPLGMPVSLRYSPPGSVPSDRSASFLVVGAPAKLAFDFELYSYQCPPWSKHPSTVLVKVPDRGVGTWLSLQHTAWLPFCLHANKHVFVIFWSNYLYPFQCMTRWWSSLHFRNICTSEIKLQAQRCIRFTHLPNYGNRVFQSNKSYFSSHPSMV